MELKTNEITQLLIHGLEYKGYYCVRQNIRVKAGRLRCTSKDGISDVWCITPKGMFLALEVKRKGEDLRDSQTEFMQEVLKRNAWYYVCESEERAIELIEKLP